MRHAAATLLSAALTLTVTPAAAFETAERFSETPYDLDAGVPQGGGGGRFYTGSLNDGFTCGVCHRRPDMVSADGFEVRDWPEEGYTPGGAAMRIVVNFPNDVLSAATLEVTAQNGAGAGTLEMVPDPTPQDQCPAVEPDPPTDAASLLTAAQGRTVAVSDACPRGLGVRGRLRVSWTPPADDIGPVWLNVAAVAANADGDPEGDAVFLFSRLIPPTGSSVTPPGSTGGCRAVPRGRGSPAWLAAAACAWWLRRRRA